MKNKQIHLYPWFLLLTTLVCIYSCKKSSPIEEAPSPYWGNSNALKNGTVWEAKPYSFKTLNNPNTFGVSLDSVDSDNQPREIIELIKIPLKEGTYRLSNTSGQEDDGLTGGLLGVCQGDVIIGVYIIAEGDTSSYITITELDTVSKQIKGKFGATFVVKHRPYAYYPDTVRFVDGVFHTKLIK